ncbi:MAG: YkgJ family cysteine cluster protein [Parcubacteria group bacterium]
MKKSIFRKDRDGNLEINWVCIGAKCNKNCCGHFVDKIPSYVSLENIKHDEIILLPKEVKKYDSNKLAHHAVNIRGNTYIKLNNSDRSCPFLDRGKCSRYSLRPALCRAYPFYIDLFSGINIDLSCPGVGGGWTKVADIKDNLESLVMVYTKHIKDIKSKYV